MPIQFQILARHALVYVRYSGAMNIDETMRAFAEYGAHAQFRPGQKQLIDLRGLTSMDHDYPALLQMQARKADAFYRPGSQTLVAYLANNDTTLHASRLIQRSWDQIDGVVIRVFTDETIALDFLGVPETRIAALLASTDAAEGPETAPRVDQRQDGPRRHRP